MEHDYMIETLAPEWNQSPALHRLAAGNFRRCWCGSQTAGALQMKIVSQRREHAKWVYNCLRLRRQKVNLAKRLLDIEMAQNQKSQTDEAKSQHEGMKWSSPTVVAIFTAALGLFGNLIVTLINDASSRDLEERKFQKELILELTNMLNHQVACDHLSIFVSIGVLLDPRGKIIDGICNKPAYQNPMVGLASAATKTADKIPAKAIPPVTPSVGAGVTSPPAMAEASGNVPGPPITPDMVTVQKVDSGENYLFNVSGSECTRLHFRHGEDLRHAISRESTVL
jgi:hypothetical protein